MKGELVKAEPRRERRAWVERVFGGGQEVERSDPVLSMDEVAELLTSFNYQGLRYTLPGAQQEEIGGSYSGLARNAYGASAPVYACIAVRMSLFAEARFQWRNLRSGHPGRIFGTPDLNILESPWHGGTTGDLLSRMELHNSLAGNAFVARFGSPPRLSLLRPDWVDIIVGSPDPDLDIGAWDPEAQVMGYVYYPGGRYSGREARVYTVDEVAHYAPRPDPLAQFRGMSWLSPIVREIMGDKATTEHKLRYFEQGATKNLMVKFNTDDLEKFRSWSEEFREQHEGVRGAYRTLFLAMGMDAEAIGDNMEQIDFKKTQGAGETRIASAAEVPPIIVGLSEGLESATYSNYGQARRRFADGTLRTLWRNVCGSLEHLVPPPGGCQLWYDEADIPFLQEDAKDAAEVLQLKATAIKTLVDAGYTTDSARDAVAVGDLSLLAHSGLISVQLQKPGGKPPPQNGGPPEKAPAPTPGGQAG